MRHLEQSDHCRHLLCVSTNPNTVFSSSTLLNIRCVESVEKYGLHIHDCFVYPTLMVRLNERKRGKAAIHECKNAFDKTDKQVRSSTSRFPKVLVQSSRTFWSTCRLRVASLDSHVQAIIFFWRRYIHGSGRVAMHYMSTGHMSESSEIA